MSRRGLEQLRDWGLPLLLPLAFLWLIASKWRKLWRRRAVASTIPVWSIGNIHVGGTGKTPVVAALAEVFASRQPVVLSRGYGGRSSRQGGWVEGSGGAVEFGDEPWMLAHGRGLRVYVDRIRNRGLRHLLRRDGVGVVLLEDGFQRLDIARCVDLVCFPQWCGPEETFCLPWGPLREPFSALGRASAFLLWGGDPRWAGWLHRHFPKTPCFSLQRQPLGLWGPGGEVPWEGGAVGAFCGVAQPEGFIRSLETLGKPHFVAEFGDHQPISAADLMALKRRLPPGGTLVTTEKDWYRLNKSDRSGVLFLREKISFSPEFIQWLEQRWGKTG